MSNMQDETLLLHMLQVIPDEARVLDLGCGDGELLSALKKLRQIKGYGIEIEFNNVLTCIQKGLSIYQGNLDEGLSGIPDQSYDFVILSQTLQEVLKPQLVIEEMLRVGKKAIVTFPNFGHWRLRSHLLFSGKTPKTNTLPYYWYNTPNIRFLTIKDFISFCKTHEINIVENIPLYENTWAHFIPRIFANLFAEKGMFVIEKKTS